MTLISISGKTNVKKSLNQFKHGFREANTVPEGLLVINVILKKSRKDL